MEVMNLTVAAVNMFVAGLLFGEVLESQGQRGMGWMLANIASAGLNFWLFTT